LCPVAVRSPTTWQSPTSTKQSQSNSVRRHHFNKANLLQNPPKASRTGIRPPGTASPCPSSTSEGSQRMGRTAHMLVSDQRWLGSYLSMVDPRHQNSVVHGPELPSKHMIARYSCRVHKMAGEWMGPGGPHGLQLRWRASFDVRGGFDSLALPPVRHTCFNRGIPASPAGYVLVYVAIASPFTRCSSTQPPSQQPALATPLTDARKSTT